MFPGTRKIYAMGNCLLLTSVAGISLLATHLDVPGGIGIFRSSPSLGSGWKYEPLFGDGHSLRNKLIGLYDRGHGAPQINLVKFPRALEDAAREGLREVHSRRHWNPAGLDAKILYQLKEEGKLEILIIWTNNLIGGSHRYYDFLKIFPRIK